MHDQHGQPLPFDLSHENPSWDRPAPSGERAADSTSRNNAPHPTKTPQTRNNAIVVVPLLLVLVTFLFWYQTWWGRRLSEQDMRQCLSDTSAPHKTQHALSQLAQQMARGDPAARQWYPLVLRLADNKEAQLRLMAAWVMGHDNQSAAFHQMLLKLLRDPEAMVRWNAALALVRFGDPAGEPELHFMLRPYGLLAPQSGTVTFRLKEQETVSAGSLVARIKGEDRRATEVRSPLAGRIERWVAKDGAQVETGQEIATISPGWEQVWEALRALYLVGEPADLNDVERFARGVAGMPDGVQRQAVLAAQAIRSRNSQQSF
jgi:hypothetical protein